MGSSSKSGPREAYVGLGSNLGDRERTILRAMDMLAEFSDGPLRRSSLWESPPVDCPPGSPAFVNAVIALRPRAEESPESLLAKLQAVEREFGRERTGRANEPRVLDLDLIAFGSLTRSSAELTLPHPRAARRQFVLQPLAEIAPDYVFPGQERTVRELANEPGRDPSVRRIIPSFTS